ncbi:MAG: phosphoribosyl-AMP cyclohydrolase [Pseudomonadales bacterium]|nr:phosphoribosyl-AMP cyclohydrolase [Pseudomonadales bacterium]
MNQTWLEQLKWDENGLVPVVTQDFKSKRILTLAWLNRTALSLAAIEKRAIYWSRSRQKIWRKGEESGHVQILHDIQLDCDGDAVCYLVEQLGGIACHTGRASCFFRSLSNEEWQPTEPVLKDPATIYVAKDKAETNG